MTTASTAEREASVRRLRWLCDAGRRLLEVDRFAERIDELVQEVDDELHQHTIVIVEHVDLLPRMLMWRTRSTGDTELHEAGEHARMAWTLLSQGAPAVRSSAEARTLLRGRSRHSPQSRSRRFVILPLQPDGEDLVGLLQLEAAREPRPKDKAFVATFAEHVAAALGRRRHCNLDLSARRGAEAAEQQSRDALAIVAHDLRNPLNASMMGIDWMLSHGGGDRSAERVLGTVRRSLVRATALVSDLLESSRLENGRFTLLRRSCDVPALVEPILEEVTVLATAKGVKLEHAIPTALPTLWVDAARLQQVLANLLSNAIGLTPAEGVVTLEVLAPAGLGEIRFIVHDTGPGIAAGDLDHVFEKFWQAGPRGSGGMGLGLAIAKEIVEAHGGWIEVVSKPGRGATFSFTVPAG